MIRLAVFALCVATLLIRSVASTYILFKFEGIMALKNVMVLEYMYHDEDPSLRHKERYLKKKSDQYLESLAKSKVKVLTDEEQALADRMAKVMTFKRKPKKKVSADKENIPKIEAPPQISLEEVELSEIEEEQ